MINDFLCSPDQQFKIQTNKVILSIAYNQALDVEQVLEGSNAVTKAFEESNTSQLWEMTSSKICLSQNLCLDTLNQGVDKNTNVIINIKHDDSTTQEWEMIPTTRKKTTEVCKSVAETGTEVKKEIKRDWPLISKRLLKLDKPVVSEYTNLVSKLGEDIDLSRNYRKFNKLSYTSDLNDE